MLLSTSEDIALKAMIYISANSGKSRCSINEIARNEAVPREYLAKILKRLVQRNLLSSKRGVFGGYQLIKNRGDISFLDIIEAIDGDFRAMVKHDQKLKIANGNHPASEFWSEMHKQISEKLSKMTLDKIDYKKFYPDS
ncbi:MAG: Rrf2 family transcriptional regulator [candidate division Zixibacteria bacterium]|nr:Rrf2 family transcriptional regulator [candidate division Zixibacteria bacterium]